MWMRLTLCVVLGSLLAGCDRVSALWTPGSEKITAAFPLRPELQVAHQALQDALRDDPASLRSMSEQFGKLLDVRALTCTATVDVGRLDTPAAIRRKVTDSACFERQDALLSDWVGLQRLRQVMALPPLVPYAGLDGRTPMPQLPEYAGTLVAAGMANAVVIKGDKRFSLVEIPGGKLLHSFAVPELSYRPALLSPNARVLAVPLGSRQLRLYETQTGAVLWDTDSYAGLLAWWPQHQAALLTQSGTGLPYLLDLASGRIEPFPATEKQLTWALSTPTADGSYLVGSHQTISRIELQRAGNGTLSAAPLRQWRTPAGHSIQNGPLFLLQEGRRLVYQTGQNLGWLDLVTEQQDSWELAQLGAHGFSKLNERQIMFDTSGSGSMPGRTHVLDTGDETIGLARDMAPRDGTLVPLLPRTGFLRRGNSGVAIGATVEIEAAQPLANLLAEAQLARQLARLEQQQAAGEAGSELTPYEQQLARQIRAMNAAAAIRDGLPRETVEAIRRGRSSGTAGQPPLAPGVKPLLTDIPANARVSVVGVYEPAETTHSTDGRRMGSVTINVQPGSTPLVLVLSSYEPVRWFVHPNGRRIEAVLVSGYHPSDVFGAGDARVLKIGSRSVYKMDSRDYDLLKRDIARYVANPVQSFQGAYKGQRFSVN